MNKLKLGIGVLAAGTLAGASILLVGVGADGAKPASSGQGVAHGSDVHYEKRHHRHPAHKHTPAPEPSTSTSQDPTSQDPTSQQPAPLQPAPWPPRPFDPTKGPFNQPPPFAKHPTAIPPDLQLRTGTQVKRFATAESCTDFAREGQTQSEFPNQLILCAANPDGSGDFFAYGFPTN